MTGLKLILVLTLISQPVQLTIFSLQESIGGNPLETMCRMVFGIGGRLYGVTDLVGHLLQMGMFMAHFRKYGLLLLTINSKNIINILGLTQLKEGVVEWQSHSTTPQHFPEVHNS